MLPDLRQTNAGVFEPDPLARPTSEIVPDARRRRILDALVSARRSGDHELANRLLGELVELNADEQKEVDNV